MKNLFGKAGAALLLVATAVMATAAMASAAPSTPEAAIEAGANSLSDGLIGIAVVVLPLAFGIALIPIGYRWVRRFIK